MTTTVIAQNTMWRAGTQWQAGENTVAESLSKEVLAALAADPNFTVSAGEMKKEGRAEKGKGKAKKKTTPKEKGIAAKPAAKPTPEQEVAPADQEAHGQPSQRLSKR